VRHWRRIRCSTDPAKAACFPTWETRNIEPGFHGLKRRHFFVGLSGAVLVGFRAVHDPHVVLGWSDLRHALSERDDRLDVGIDAPLVGDFLDDLDLAVDADELLKVEALQLLSREPRHASKCCRSVAFSFRLSVYRLVVMNCRPLAGSAWSICHRMSTFCFSPHGVACKPRSTTSTQTA